MSPSKTRAKPRDAQCILLMLVRTCIELLKGGQDPDYRKSDDAAPRLLVGRVRQASGVEARRSQFWPHMI
jgi:hypothetical protein